jgi:hypothetical protein
MTVPLHQYASVPLALNPETVCERLVADPQQVVRRATADALTAMGPHLRRWGQRIAALPTTTARTTGSEALGCVELVWAGAEQETGWPALTGHLVVTPAGPTGSRLRLFSRRSPHGGLASSRLDPLHGQRIVHGTVQRFLRDLGHHLDDRGARPPGAAVVKFERAPMFVHHLQELSGGSGATYERLTSDLQGLAERATVTAVTGARATLQAGRFRAPARPTVRVRLAQAGDPACAWVGWVGDEEATGWPQLELALLLDAHPAGTRLALLSTREPGYDLSLPRIDKHQRDQMLRSAGPAFAAAVRDGLPGGSAGRPSEPRPQLVSAGG